MTDVPRRMVLVWAAMAGLTFLVGLQAFEIATGQRVDLAVKAGVALAVAVAGAATTAAVRTRLRQPNERH